MARMPHIRIGAGPHRYSIYRQVIFSQAILYLVIIGLMLANSLYSIDITRKKLYDRLYDALYLQKQQVDDGLNKAQYYLAAQLPNTASVSVVLRNQQDSEYYLNLYRLRNEMNNTLITLHYVKGIFILPLSSHLFISVSKETPVATGIREFIKEGDEGGMLEAYKNKGWFPVLIDGRYQFLRIIKNRDCYFGIWTDFATILSSVKNQQTLEQTALYIMDEGATVFNDNSQLYELNIPVENMETPYSYIQTDERYMTIVSEVGFSPGDQIALLIPDRLISEELSRSYFLSLVLVLSVFALAIAMVFVLLRYLHKPIDQLKSSILALRNGDFSTRISSDYECEEFTGVNTAFNDMVSRIEDLKIDVYEEKLSQQLSQMRYLKNQIAPHFLINCLNSIYHTASAGDTESVKSMAVRLGNHLRYILSDVRYVTLGSELEETANYVELARLRYSGNITLHADIPEQLRSAMTLPMLILNFAENTIKHEMANGRVIEIHVKAELKGEEQNRLHITLWDTGTGWSDEALQKFQKEISHTEDGHHIGVWNLYQRLKIEFETEFYMDFSNRPEAGAQMDIEIPVLSDKILTEREDET